MRFTAVVGSFTRTANDAYALIYATDASGCELITPPICVVNGFINTVNIYNADGTSKTPASAIHRRLC